MHSLVARLTCVGISAALAVSSAWSARLSTPIAQDRPSQLATVPQSQVVTPPNTTLVVTANTPVANHPSGTVAASPPLKVVGGGARSNATAYGSLLTSTQPSPGGWSGESKDHQFADPTTLSLFAVGLSDPADDWDIGIFQATSPPTNHPSVSVTLPAGYVLTGGGCTDNWAAAPGGAGNLLTASYPSSATTWQCDGKDHAVASPATITAFIVGIRPKKPGVALPTLQITRSLSAVGQYPSAVAPTPQGFVLTGGGARALPTDPNGWGSVAHRQLSGTRSQLHNTHRLACAFQGSRCRQSRHRRSLRCQSAVPSRGDARHAPERRRWSGQCRCTHGDTCHSDCTCRYKSRNTRVA